MIELKLVPGDLFLYYDNETTGPGGIIWPAIESDEEYWRSINFLKNYQSTTSVDENTPGICVATLPKPDSRSYHDDVLCYLLFPHTLGWQWSKRLQKQTFEGSICES